MASVFTKILQGTLPARFVYQDEQSAAFLTLSPIRPGHTLLVPRMEVEHWIDLPVELAQHLMRVGQQIGRAMQKVFPCTKIGMMIAGLEVPHVHLHLLPIDTADDLVFANAQRSPLDVDLDAHAKMLRDAIRKSD